MGIKVAIATSDGLNIDLHFGQAKSFLLYEFKDGKFELSEKREVPADAATGDFGCPDVGGGVVAAQIGQGMRRQLERNAISVFDIEIPVEDALKKLAAYYAKFGE